MRKTMSPESLTVEFLNQGEEKYSRVAHSPWTNPDLAKPWDSGL